MSRSEWFVAFLITLASVAALMIMSEMHSWSSSATTWALNGVLAAPLAIEFVLIRWRKRSGRRHGRRGATHPTR
jgi:membrane protein implicated in regulation of membrane protease activity